MSAQKVKQKKKSSGKTLLGRIGFQTKSKKNPASKQRRTNDRWMVYARYIVVTFFLASVAILGLTLTLSYYARDLPTVESLKNYNPPQISRIVDRNGDLIATLFRERRTVVPMSRIPRVLVLSVLAAEDADFYVHEGLDYTGIFRALLLDLKSGKVRQGASTITQQIVKNILLTPERTIARKIRELILTRRLEQKLDKDQLLFLYLNHINFGHARYGVQEACNYYFNKNVEDVDLAEASLIAGIPRSPTRYSPRDHFEAARKRQLYVLDQLQAKRDKYWDDLPLQEIEKARKKTIKIVDPPSQINRAPEVTVLATRVLREQVGKKAASNGGYTVHTSIDIGIQKKAREALRSGLMQIDKRQKLIERLRANKRNRTKRMAKIKKLRVGRIYNAVVTSTDDKEGAIWLDIGGHSAITHLEDNERFNPARLPPSQFVQKGVTLRASIQKLAAGEKQLVQAKLELGPQGAVVVIDPRSRDVLALIGSDRPIFGFNRAMNAVRQPGSAFKPIVYALALDSGSFTPASLVLDAPEVYDKWKPNNYETWHYAGAVRLREALAKSINLVAVRVTNQLTPQAVVSFAKELGITSPLDPSLALGLGASGVRPIELVNAYASFAAGGRYVPYEIIKKITDGNGRNIALPKPQKPRGVMKPAAAYLITSLLCSVVREGTASAANKLRRPAAGKTGTSNRARDAWFVGYTPEVVAGVWVGYDDQRPLGRGESGSKSALPIWISLMREILTDKPVVHFPMPSGIETAKIDPESGLLAYEGMEDAIEEFFLAGTVPTETARPPDLLDTNTFLIEQLGGLENQ